MVLSVRGCDAVSLVGFQYSLNSPLIQLRSVFYCVCESRRTILANFSHPKPSPGDVADDKYFRKVNNSDATQFGLMFPSIPAHGEV